MTASLPQPGTDVNTWGPLLNAWLLVSHNSDGTLNTSAVQTAATGNFVPVDSGASAAGPIGSATQIPIVTCDAYGLVTALTSVNIASQPLVPTAVQNSNYTATAFQFVPLDSSGGTFTVKFPGTPNDQTVVGFRVVKTGNTITAQTQSGDSIYTASGTTGNSFTIANTYLAGGLWQYVQASTLWLPLTP